LIEADKVRRELVNIQQNILISLEDAWFVG